MDAKTSLSRAPTLDRWLDFSTRYRIKIRTGKVEFGQRLHRALVFIAASELSVSPDLIDVEPVDTETSPNEGYTVGSNSLEQSGGAIRAACATAKTLLLRLASARLGIAESEFVITPNGHVVATTPEGTHSISLWELAESSSFAVSVDAELACEYGDVPHSRLPTDTDEQSGLARGTTTFVHDLRFQGMWHARVIRPPMRYAELIDFPDDRLAKITEGSGVRVIRKGGFVAVAGPCEYSVITAAEKVRRRLNWRRTHELSTKPVFDQLRQNPRISLPVVDGIPHNSLVPSLNPPPADGAGVITLCFEKPYLLHGSLAPSAAAAEFRSGKLRIWSHSQGIQPLRSALANALDLEMDNIDIEHVRGPGCYGHNGADDAALDAALVAIAHPERPILLKWSRADEHAWEPCGPAMRMELRAIADAGGQIIHWSHETMSDTHLMRAFPHLPDAGAERLLATGFLKSTVQRLPVAEPVMTHHAGIHRNLEPGYRVGTSRLVKTLVRDLPLRTSSLRSLGAAGNVYAIEGMMDELASMLDRDPIEYRLAHLDDARSHQVLSTLHSQLPEQLLDAEAGTAWGVAYAQYKNEKARCAVAVRLGIDDYVTIQLQQVIIVADAGRVVDRQGVCAQLEGGFFQAASWALIEEVRFDEAGVTSVDWETYPVLPFERSCLVDTILISQQTEPCVGVGEASAGPSVAAIANAASRLLGTRLTRLPLSAEHITEVLLRGD